MRLLRRAGLGLSGLRRSHRAKECIQVGIVFGAKVLEQAFGHQGFCERALFLEILLLESRRLVAGVAQDEIVVRFVDDESRVAPAVDGCYGGRLIPGRDVAARMDDRREEIVA